MSLDLNDNLSQCDSGFNGKLNQNFKKLNAIYKKSVIDIVSTLPDSPEKDDSYIVMGTIPIVYFFDGLNWQPITVETGEIFYIQNNESFSFYDGDSMVSLGDQEDTFSILNYPTVTNITDPDFMLVNQGSLERKISWEDVLEKIKEEVLSSVSGSVPVGTVLAFTGDVIPSGYLLCDGSAINRFTYSDLFSVIGTSHGQGNGATTFLVPDYRGMFLRMVDSTSLGRDPDRMSRTPMNSGGNEGQRVGSIQTDRTRIPPGVYTNEGGSHTHSTDIVSTQSTGSSPETLLRGRYFSTSTISIISSPSGVHSHSVSGGDLQTAPINAYVNYIIKAI